VAILPRGPQRWGITSRLDLARMRRTGGTPRAFPWGMGACVLVGERETARRSALAAGLRGDGHVVLEARDGLQLMGLLEFAVEVLGCPVDELVVVADTSLAGLSGLDVLTVLRAAGRRTVVVLVAAPDDVAARREAEALGAVVIDRDGDAAAAARAAARTRAALDLQARRGHARAPARA
jgi:CheY-like chemotaxis protein